MIRRLCIAALAAIGLVPWAAAADTYIDCDSGGYRYTYCPIETGRGVELDRQKSTIPCTFNQTWGYDEGGIWVDQGCRGRFRILSANRRPTPTPEPVYQDDDDIIPQWMLQPYEDDDDADHRDEGFGRVDAALACADRAEAESRKQRAVGVQVDSLDNVVPRGWRNYDVWLTVTVDNVDRTLDQLSVTCTVKRGRVTSYKAQ